MKINSLYKIIEIMPITLHLAAILELLDSRGGLSTSDFANAFGYKSSRSALWALAKYRRKGYVSATRRDQLGNQGAPENIWIVSRKGKSALTKVQTAVNNFK